MATTAVDRAVGEVNLSSAHQIAVKAKVHAAAWELYDAVLIEKGEDAIVRIKVPLLGLKVATIRVRQVAPLLGRFVELLVGPR